MKTMQLLEGLEFADQAPNAEPLYVDAHGRVLRFTLKPGQSIREHNAPHSPLYVVVLQGHGMFTGGDGHEQQLGPNSLLIFDPAEGHAIRAINEALVFVSFLHGVPGMPLDKVGGTLTRDHN